MNIVILPGTSLEPVITRLSRMLEQLRDHEAIVLSVRVAKSHNMYRHRLPESPVLREQKAIFARLRYSPAVEKLRKSEIAQRVGLNPSQFGIFINGIQLVTQKVWLRIPEAFGVDPDHPDIVRLGELVKTGT